VHSRVDDAPAIGAARVAVRRCLASCGWHRNAVDVAVLVASELLTNALQHAAPPVDLDVEPHGELVRITVHDATPDAPRVREHGGAEGGFGLRLVARASVAWGWDADACGKAVWAELHDDGAGAFDRSGRFGRGGPA
jgi:anti-sigma regulatory factor (Ser/Thr protein kinase)